MKALLSIAAASLALTARAFRGKPSCRSGSKPGSGLAVNADETLLAGGAEPLGLERQPHLCE